MNEPFLIRAFVLYHQLSESDAVRIIYIGADKAKAFDALVEFLFKSADHGMFRVEYSKDGQE